MWLMGKRTRVWKRHYDQVMARITPGQKRELKDKACRFGRRVSRKVHKARRCFR